MTFDYYATLGVSPDAEPEVIRAAYRALAQKHHPDRNNQSRKSHEVTARLNEAYHVLSDPELRRNYDAERFSKNPAPEQEFREDEFQPTPGIDAEAAGRAFTLNFIPGQVVTNEVWIETRGGGAFSALPFGPKMGPESIPMQRIGVRTNDDVLSVTQSGSHIPLTFGDNVELVQVSANDSQREGVVAIVNQSTGQWFWIGSQLEAGRLFRTTRMFLIDLGVYLGGVGLLFGLFWFLLIRNSSGLVATLYLCIGLPMLFKVATPMLALTGHTLGMAVRAKIQEIVDGRSPR